MVPEVVLQSFSLRIKKKALEVTVSDLRCREVFVGSMECRFFLRRLAVSS